MIKEANFNKVFPTIDGKEILYIILEDYSRTKAGRLNWKQKLILEQAHKYLGFGSLNKSCKDCLRTGMNKVLDHLNKYVSQPEVKVVPMVTKKKVSKKAEQVNLDESIKEVMSEIANDFEPGERIPTNYMALKKYAENKLGKKYPKGTKAKTIRKDLGVK